MDERELGSIADWAADLTRRFYNVWQQKYSDHKQGFQIFAGQVVARPRILIITENPGVLPSVDRFREYLGHLQRNGFRPESYVPYLGLHNRSTVGPMMNYLLGESVLKDSVATWLCFLRTKTLKQIDSSMIEVCAPFLNEIIRVVEPQRILLVGRGTWPVEANVPTFRMYHPNYYRYKPKQARFQLKQEIDQLLDSR